VLPRRIAERLKNEPDTTIADRFESATVLFSDIVGFTQLSARLAPDEIVRRLDEVFSSFDQIADELELEKIKTIGDAYMVAGGVPARRKDHAEAVCDMALRMRDCLASLAVRLGEPIEVRIGVHTGPVVAGVIGKKKFIYDVWGDTVNTASRMESHGVPGSIQVSAATYEETKSAFDYESRGTITVKGKGEMSTYLLLRRRAPEAERVASLPEQRAR
jgi:class 3 adenylate cyclase